MSPWLVLCRRYGSFRLRPLKRSWTTSFASWFISIPVFGLAVALMFSGDFAPRDRSFEDSFLVVDDADPCGLPVTLGWKVQPSSSMVCYSDLRAFFLRSYSRYLSSKRSATLVCPWFPVLFIFSAIFKECAFNFGLNCALELGSS